jgi:hypothetical protein
MNKAHGAVNSKWGKAPCYEIGMRSLVVCFGLALLVGSAVAPQARAEGGSAPKNLQVLPKTMTKDQVKTIMKGFSKSLGVECDFCHDVPDMASDKLPHKQIARQMMKMTQDINAKWLDGKNGPKAEVSCNTCHRGEAKPKKD